MLFRSVISDFIALTLLLLPRRVPEPVHAHAHARDPGNVIDGQFRRER